MCHLEDMNCQEEDEKEYQEMNTTNQDRSEELRAALVNSLNKLRSEWQDYDNRHKDSYGDGTINGLRLAIDIVHSLTLPNSSRIIP